MDKDDIKELYMLDEKVLVMLLSALDFNTLLSSIGFFFFWIMHFVMFYIAAKAGIVLLPSTHQLDEKVSEEQIEKDMAEEEENLLMCPNKPGMPDSDIFDRDQSWFDGPPVGFSLTVSLL